MYENLLSFGVPEFIYLGTIIRLNSVFYSISEEVYGFRIMLLVSRKLRIPYSYMLGGETV